MTSMTLCPYVKANWFMINNSIIKIIHYVLFLMVLTVLQLRFDYHISCVDAIQRLRQLTTHQFSSVRFCQSWLERLFGQIRPYFEIFCFQLMMLILSKPLRNSSLSSQNHIFISNVDLSLFKYICKIELKHKW